MKVYVLESYDEWGDWAVVGAYESAVKAQVASKALDEDFILSVWDPETGRRVEPEALNV